MPIEATLNKVNQVYFDGSTVSINITDWPNNDGLDISVIGNNEGAGMKLMGSLDWQSIDELIFAINRIRLGE